MTAKYLNKWGFVSLADCIGKTIEAVEELQAEAGATFHTCTLIKFTDGTRAWVTGRSGRNIIPGPSLDAMGKSSIIPAEEYGEAAAQSKRRADERRAQRERAERRELKRLQEKYGGTT